MLMKQNYGFSYPDNREIHVKFERVEMDNEVSGWVTVLAIVIAVGFGIHSCSVTMDSPEYKAKKEAEEKVCETPQIVSQAGGITLWVVRPNCDRPVYFSEKGTHTTHSERHGKTSTEVDDDTSSD